MKWLICSLLFILMLFALHHKATGQNDTCLPGKQLMTLELIKPVAISENIPANVTDSLALVDLYYATSGINWVNNGGWLIDPVYFWAGILVNAEGAVIGIGMPNNNLSGSLPPSIGNLSNLNSLILYNNNLIGTIPGDIGNLNHLKYLNLSTNQLTGNIPASIGNLSQLITLHLGDNQLTGQIPYSLGNLVNLSTLTLLINQLSGTIPSSIGNLIGLNELSLCNNQLTDTIPRSIGNLINLNYLDISNNLLSGTIPNELCNLSLLNLFIFTNNYFDLSSCPTIECMIDNGVNIIGSGQNGIEFPEDCGATGFVDIGIEEDFICKDGSGYFFGYVYVSANFYYIYWYSYGDGYFDCDDCLYPTYYPGASDYQNGFVEICVEVTGDFGTADDCMILNFLDLPDGHPGNDATINAGNSYTLSGAWAENYSGLYWTTSGDGSFSSEFELRPVYTPGAIDIINGSVILCLNLMSECIPLTICMTLSIVSTGQFDQLFLSPGWNLISFDVTLDPDTPTDVLESLITNGNLVTATGFQNQQGVFFLPPPAPPYLNTLQHLNDGEGYWVKVTNAATLSVTGDAIPTTFTINLKTGWNLFGYWPEETTTPAIAFASLIDAGILEMVTSYENGGLFFDPDGFPPLNTLTEIKNGLGYWVKVSEDYPGFSFP